MHKFLLPLLLICFSLPTLAQQPGSRNLRITVEDENKNALPGSTVYLLSRDSIFVRSRIVDANGLSEFVDLAPGNYRVRANHTGYDEGYSAWLDL